MKPPLKFEYDAASDVISIEGLRFSGELFRSLAQWEIGACFRIEQREHGVLCLSKCIDNAQIVEKVNELAEQLKRELK